MKARYPRLPLAIALVILLFAARDEAGAQNSAGAAGDRITVKSELSQDEGVADIQANCEINGGMLYVDRAYVGAVPYVGTVSPGRHYIELALPGYDNMGIWLDLAAKTKYSIDFNPKGTFALFATDKRATVSTEPTLNAGSSDLEIYSDVNGGMLYIDQVLIGSTGTTIPYTGSTTPGSHYFELELGRYGYRSLGLWLLLEEKTRYTIILHPQKATGHLSVDADPRDASLSLDGAPLALGLSEQPVGKRRILARRFGYADRSLDVEIQDGATSSVKVVLEKVPFALGGLGFSRAAFNPRNAGPSGRVSLNFRVSSYGSAKAEIRGPDGGIVATLDYPDMKDWSQSAVWNGLGPGGVPLPDGQYTARLVATPAETGEGLVAEAQVEIDSSLVVRPIGTASGMAGLLYMPESTPESAGAAAVESYYFVPLESPTGSPEDSAFGISAAMSVGGLVTLALQASAETAAGPVNTGDLAGSALVALFGDRASPMSGAFFLRGGYSGAVSPAMPGAGSAVEASLPLSARVGGASGTELRIAFAPGARADFSSSSPALLGLGRAGIWLEGRNFMAGLSGELPVSFAGDPAPLWPAKLALEGRLMLGSSPFVAALYSTAELSPVSAPAFGIGLGLGLLF
jgi:hypothetical protein